jgi:hypothetical protein
MPQGVFKVMHGQLVARDGDPSAYHLFLGANQKHGLRLFFLKCEEVSIPEEGVRIPFDLSVVNDNGVNIAILVDAQYQPERMEFAMVDMNNPVLRN